MKSNHYSTRESNSTTNQQTGRRIFGTFRIAFILLMAFPLFWMGCKGGILKYDKGAQYVALQPFEDMDTTQIAMVKKAIEDFYGFDVMILEAIELPADAWYAPTERYRAKKLLDNLLEKRPSDIDKIIGFTNRDISARIGQHKDYYITSKSYRNGAAGVISTYRIKKYAESGKQFYERLEKVSLREVGKTLGLSTCENSDHCLMRPLNGSSKALNKAETRLCDECSKRLGWSPATTASSDE